MLNRSHTSQRAAGDREKPTGRASSDPFDRLPRPSRKRFAASIRKNVKDVISSLSAFSRSIHEGSNPAWPSKATFALFNAQLAAFRSISTRRNDALPIELVREMNHRWKSLRLRDTLTRVVCALEDYSGKSLFGQIHVQERFEWGIATGSLKKHPLRLLVLKFKEATPADLPVMLSAAPTCFIELETSLKHLPTSAATEARTALALSVQEYLWSEHRRFLSHQAVAFPLRNFLFELKDPSYKKHLFGFSDEEIQAWEAFDNSLQPEKQRKQQSARSAKFREKQKTKRAE